MAKTNTRTSVCELEIAQERSQVISSLRFPMALGVVFLHAGLVSDDISQKVEAGEWIILKVCTNALSTLFNLAVPLFFIISAYLFFKKFRNGWSWNGYKGQLRRRAWTLLVPYLIWNAVSVFGWVQNEFRLGHSLNEYFSNYTLWGFLKHFWQSGVHHEEHFKVFGLLNVSDYPALVPLWFVRDLMVMMVLAPLFYFMIKKIGGWLPLLFIPLYVLSIRLNIQGFSTVAFLFFSIGAWASLTDMDFTNVAVRFLHIVFPLTAIFYISAVFIKVQTLGIKNFDIVEHLFIVLGCFCTLGLFTLIVRKRKTKILLALASTSFFIFVAHGIEYLGTLCWSRKILTTVFGYPTSEISAMLMYVVNPLLATTLCILCVKLMARYLPRFTAFICGGRS